MSETKQTTTGQENTTPEKAKAPEKAPETPKATPKKKAPKVLAKVLVGKNELMLVGKGKKVFKGRKVDFTTVEWKALPQYYKDLFTDYVAPKEG